MKNNNGGIPYDVLEDKELFSSESRFFSPKDRTYFLSRVGEFGTIMKLSRYGIFASLTQGNKKGFDVIATGDNNKYATIEVKTSNKNRIVTNFFQRYGDSQVKHPDFWVLVCTYAESNSVYKEKFFVLTHEELKQIQWETIHRGCIRKNISMTMEEFIVAELIRKENKTSGVDSVSIDDLKDYEEDWTKIFNFLNS